MSDQSADVQGVQTQIPAAGPYHRDPKNTDGQQPPSAFSNGGQ
jgi:hypothetical protein